MYFANPWGLLGLLSLPAILVIHLYHRRFPPLNVAGLHLWGVETRKESPGRTREQLPLTRTLLLELLAALLITLLIADPRSGSSAIRPHLVLVLDNSASMAAISPETQKSSRDRVLEWVTQQEARLGKGTVFSVLTTGRRPTLIAGPQGSWQETVDALKNWQPRETLHAFEPAWDLGAQLAGEESEYVFLTDRLPPENVSAPQRMSVQSFGKSLNNVAITAARWLFDAEAGEGVLFVRVANLGLESTQVEITATAKEQPLFSESHELTAGMEKSFEWIVPGGLGVLQLTAASRNDPLAIDHTLQLVEPGSRLVTVAVTLPSAHPAFENVRRILGVMPGTQLGDPGEADLVIAPAADPPVSQRGLWWLGIGPVSLEDSALSAAKALVGPYLVEKQHALVEGIVLGGVVWGGVQTAPEGLIPIISTGSSLLLGQWQNSASQAFLLNINLSSSNLTESPDWPILWTNLIEQCRNSRPGFRRWNYHLQESILFTLSAAQQDSEQELLLIHGDNRRPLLRTETVEISPRDDVGLYEVRDGEQRLGLFAVNFLDREESNLLALATGNRPATDPAEPLGIHWDNPFSWLIVLGILLVLLAIFADWYVLRRRR